MREFKTFLDRFEGPWAVLRTEAGKEILFPTSLIEDFKEGDVVFLKVGKDEEGGERYEKLAKKILQEILNVQEEKTKKES